MASDPTVSPPRGGQRRRGGRSVFILLAIASLAAAIAVYVLRDRLGFEPAVGGLVALALLLVFAFDVIVVLAWDRIFKRMA